MKKYAHLVKRINTRPGPGGALPKHLIWLEEEQLEGIPLNFGGGDHFEVGDWHTWAGFHTHEHDEILFFLGLDPQDIASLGAEVAMEIGEEQEEHIIRESAVVVVPRGLSHGPFTTLKVDRPFRGCHILLAPRYEVNWMPKEAKKPKTTGNKYSYLIKTFAGKIIHPAKTGVGPGNADNLVWFFGRELENLPINFTWGIYSGCGVWHREQGKSLSHVHDFDEILIFMGLDPNNIDYLGAEIQVEIGPEHELHVFSEPSVVIFPKGLEHTPVVTRWVDSPYCCFVISMSPEYKAHWIQK